MAKLIIKYNIILPLLALLISISLSSNNSIVLSQNDESSSDQPSTEQMNGGGDGMGGNLISSVTEWIGVFALGFTTGLLAFGIKISNKVTAFVKRRNAIAFFWRNHRYLLLLCLDFVQAKCWSIKDNR
jgi:hypothetical protein